MLSTRNSLLTLVSFLAMLATPLHAATLFWTDPAGPSGSHVIRRTGAGSSVPTIVTGLRDPRGMAVDPLSGYIYWTEPGALRIGRTTLDGLGPVETVVATEDAAAGVALDLANGKMYWSDSNNGDINAGIRSGRIRRSNLDGTDVEDVVTTGLLHPVTVSLDIPRGKIYWSDIEQRFDGLGTINRANLDGSGVEVVVSGVDEPTGIALDVDSGWLYWTDIATQRIQKSQLDGSSIQDFAVGLTMPTTLGLDAVYGKLYWTDSLGGPETHPNNRIEQANLDGTGREVVISGVGLPWGIAVAPDLPLPPLCQVTLDFNVPATTAIRDASGLGTGFTHRLPGTGGNLPESDPNLDMTSAPGKLRITSTNADINQSPGPTGNNLPNLETLGVYVPGVGGNGVVIKATFEDIHVPNGSDQLMIWAGVDENTIVRAGVHQGNVFVMSLNNGFGDMNTFTSADAFATGDDVEVTLARRNGLWALSWLNLTTMTTGSLPGVAVPWLDSHPSLYFGVLAANAGTTTPFVATIDDFSVTCVPEPAAMLLLLVGAAACYCAGPAARRNGRLRRQAA